MKYILEIKPEYEANGIMILGARDSHLYVTTLEVKDLEELNFDYINEHFGDLQDEAYKKGVHDGESKCGYCTEYQRGFEYGKAQSDRGCEGCEYAGKVVTGPPCITCCNSYKNQWTAKQTDDKIEVGDEVNWIGDCFIVTRIFQPRNMKEQCDGIDDDGCVYHDVLMDDLEKTGRHFDISSILKEMQS